MEEKTFDRRKILLICIGVLILILLVAGVTYAYFQHQIGNPASGNVGVDTDIPDNLVFDVSNDINITITQFNFGPDDGNQSDNAVASASLTANSTNDTANYTYYVYFKINTNEYVYTTQDSQTEILLKVTDPTDQPVTSIEGLTYNSTLGGFDITEANGTFAVASNYPITSNSSTTPTVQEWNFDVTFINLDTDQGENAGKKMDAEIIIQQNELKPTLADYVISQYTGTDGENALYYHDADLANGAADNSYRYAGASANVNNYVCFGDDCSNEDNLYRIIGVFDNEVKLIKATSYGNYVWDADNVNTWDATTKPDIYTTLNDTYYNSLGTTWQNKIADATWQVGGFPNTYFNDSLKTNYDYEVGVNQTGYEETMKIGLMYVGDYGYASGSNNWTASLYDYGEATDPNEGWLYLGVYEWTISRNSGLSYSAWFVTADGYLDYGLSVTSAYAVRPSFYLTSSTTYVSGSGAATDPIVIN